MMEEDNKDLKDDIRRLQETLEKDGNQFYDYVVDSDEDSDDEDVLYIDLSKHASAPQSVASVSARSVGATPSIRSQPSTETQSMITEVEDESDMFREVGVVWDKLDSNTLPPTIESCLVINRAYQDIIQEHVSRIELELAENREAQRRLEEEARDSTIQQKARKRFPYSMTTPYFKMRGNLAPPPNEDVILKTRSEEPDLDTRPEAAWSAKHKRLLKDAVCEDALEKIIKPLLNRRELDEEKLSKVAEMSEEHKKIMERISAIDKEIEEKSKTPRDILLQTADPERVDWMKIANITFQGRRDWMSCRRAWQHSVDPRLNQSPMKEDEEERLAKLIKETDGSNWVYIAQQLGTGRTAFQCLQYYQQHLNQEMIEKPWTPEEEKHLIDVVQRCQQMHFNWNKVSQFMEGRSSAQCYKRFTKLDPSINKGLWTEQEDAQLMAAVQLLGSFNWGRVSELVPGRTREQCRERFNNSLDPNISGKPWTYEEDRELLQLMEKYGGKAWGQIAKGLPGRTDNQVLQRYRRLEDWQRKSDWFKMQSSRDRELLQGNNLPANMRTEAHQKNWIQFRKKYGILPDDYRKQENDIAKGLVCVPRPPFIVGLANQHGSKMWERRIKLHKLIESHIDKLKEKYSFAVMGNVSGALNTTVTGVYELQDEIAQLSQECLAQRDRLLQQRDQLLENRHSRLDLLIHNLPSKLAVKDLLAVTRGKRVHVPQKRGPNPRKRPTIITPRLKKQMKVDSELRKVVRGNLRERSLKKGRPRRFFWDLKGDQRLGEEELTELRGTTLNLFLKSLAVDHAALVKEGRKGFPEQYRKLKDQFNKEDHGEDADNDGDNGKSVRRSRRVDQKKKEEKPGTNNPFSMGGQPLGMSFDQFTKQKDYELLEWLARRESLHVDFEPPPDVAMANKIPTAGFENVRTVPKGKSKRKAESHRVMEVPSESESSSRPAVRHNSPVEVSMEQAVMESAAQRKEGVIKDDHRNAAENGHLDASAGGDNQGLITGAGDASNSTVSHITSLLSPPWPQAGGDAPTTSAHLGFSITGPTTSNGSTPGPSGLQSSGHQRVSNATTNRTIPNLPPTATTVTSFRELLLKRLGLIKTAGSYYNLSYYLAKRDNQVARLIRAGMAVQELSRGTMDLNKMMNRVSQETSFKRSKLYRKQGVLEPPPSCPTEEPAENKALDFTVLDSLRKTDDYKLLEARFQSVFMWPALLSTVYPPFVRADYASKAGGKTSRMERLLHPNFETSKKQLPLLKSKQFYKFANKTRAEKAAIIKKHRERRILRQVQELLADENDPNPEVTLDPDSDDPEASNNPTKPTVASSLAGSLQQAGDEAVVAAKPCATIVKTEAAESLPGPSCTGGRRGRKRGKYNLKKAPSSGPVRHSSRFKERKTYKDAINKKRLHLSSTRHCTDSETEPKVAMRPRIPRFRRKLMINTMVDLQYQKKYPIGNTSKADDARHCIDGCYMSDEDDAAVMGQMVKELKKHGRGDLDSLGEEQRQSLAYLEQESIVDHPRRKRAASEMPCTSSMNGSSFFLDDDAEVQERNRQSAAAYATVNGNNFITTSVDINSGAKITEGRKRKKKTVSLVDMDTDSVMNGHVECIFGENGAEVTSVDISAVSSMNGTIDTPTVTEAETDSSLLSSIPKAAKRASKSNAEDPTGPKKARKASVQKTQKDARLVNNGVGGCEDVAGSFNGFGIRSDGEAQSDCTPDTALPVSENGKIPSSGDTVTVKDDVNDSSFDVDSNDEDIAQKTDFDFEKVGTSSVVPSPREPPAVTEVRPVDLVLCSESSFPVPPANALNTDTHANSVPVSENVNGASSNGEPVMVPSHVKQELPVPSQSVLSMPGFSLSSMVNLPMPNLSQASIPGLGRIQPSVALALPSADNKGLVLLLPNSADPNGPPIQLNIPLPVDPTSGVVSVPIASSSFSTVPTISGATVASTTAFTLSSTSMFSSYVSSTSVSPSPTWTVPSGPTQGSNPAIQDGVFRQIPAHRGVVELDSDSDGEPSVAKLLATKRAKQEKP